MASLRGAIGIEIVIFVYIFGNIFVILKIAKIECLANFLLIFD